jgi:NAD(P)-dependent dehydrogenase (short-subunit alcohol dehydrogenase family)
MSKTILITGATDGIGKQTALDLARQGHRVLLHGRNLERGQAVLAELCAATNGAATGSAALEYFNADFASLAEVRRLAAEVQAKHERLDALIANAGVYLTQRQLSADGYELTFAVNHLAHFLLTNLLLDTLKRSAPARIVVVASQVHRSGRLDFSDLHLARRYDGYTAYANSKLANVLFTYALAERLKGTGVTVNALHPGVIGTKLLHVGWGLGGAGVDAGAQTSVYLAASPKVADVTGKYFEDKREQASSRASHDEQLQAELWRVSDQLTGLQPDDRHLNP